MAEPVQSVDHSGLLRLLLEQYKWRRDATPSHISGMISMVAAELNLTEQAAQELLTAFDIQTAVGAQLDLLGKIFGAVRAGASDATFRARILSAAVLANSGTAEQVIGYIRSVIGGSTPIRMLPVAPAKFYVYHDTGALPGITLAQVQAVSPAGVGVVMGDILALSDGTPLGSSVGDTFLVGA